MEERIVKADPVLNPDEYKAELIAFLGGDDPAEVLEATPGTFRKAVEGLSAETLQQRPEPNEWSVEELLSHFWHAEVVASFRWRVVLAQDNPMLIGYDQDAWTDLPRPPFHDMLDAFEALRRANVSLMRGTDQSLWDRAGEHTERGPESFRDGVYMIAGHDRAHLKQLTQTIDAVT
ncbi:MAG: hypothetical protein QOG54_1013 [Actinomycetota bacterium]|nr:hypothetical protein [Actinomycetota bacterium]